MTKEERKEYVEYRIKTAYETYDAAKVLANNNFWNSSVNRLYYSVFYSVYEMIQSIEEEIWKKFNINFTHILFYCTNRSIALI
jgi:uncharacterized protein (UPF0332 family)